MKEWLLWYLASLVLGWLAFPIAYRLLPALKDRGYSLSRVLGILIWGYSFWTLASLGMLPFDMGGLLFSAALLAALSVWAASGIPRSEFKEWLVSQGRLVAASELLFLACFAGWAVVRAANPEALGTEKPMELAFINAILRSRTFPPHDPWLSGYAISYYYFGFVLVAMLAKLTATAGSIAFNLGVVLVFALSAAGAYGIVYNLLNAWKRAGERSIARRPRSRKPPLRRLGYLISASAWSQAYSKKSNRSAAGCGPVDYRVVRSESKRAAEPLLTGGVR